MQLKKRRNSLIRRYLQLKILNQLPNRYICSATPVAMLCVILADCARKQGSSPGGDKVLWNKGGKEDSPPSYL